MVDSTSVAVTKSAEKLESYPPLLYLLQERSSTGWGIFFNFFFFFISSEGGRNVPNSVVETAVQVLAYHVPRSISLDDSLVGDGIWDVGERFLFVYLGEEAISWGTDSSGELTTHVLSADDAPQARRWARALRIFLQLQGHRHVWHGWS